MKFSIYLNRRVSVMSNLLIWRILFSQKIRNIFVIFSRKEVLTFRANCLKWRQFCIKCRILFSRENTSFKNASENFTLSAKRLTCMTNIYECFQLTMFTQARLGHGQLLKRTGLVPYEYSLIVYCC